MPELRQMDGFKSSHRSKKKYYCSPLTTDSQSVAFTFGQQWCLLHTDVEEHGHIKTC